MDGQTPPRLAHSASGHVLHVCHNCGWTFPNSHPSAKQRRSHRKVCGTIEGHKKLGSVDLDGSSHSNVSDDDKDCKNPSSELLDVSGTEKENTESLKKSENELYSDAATEFSAAGIGAVAKGGAIDEGNDSRKEPKAGTKPEGSTMKSLSTCKSEYFQSEESAFLLNDEPTKSETQKDMSRVIDGDFEGSSKLAVDDTKAAGESPDADDGIVSLKIPESHENSDGLAEKNDEEVNEDVLVVSVANDLLGNDDAEVMLEDFKDHRAHLNQSVTPEFGLAKEIDDDEATIGIPASGSRVLLEEDSGLSEIEVHKRSDDLVIPGIVTDLTEKESEDISSSIPQANCSDIEYHLAGEDDRGKAVKNSDAEAPVTASEKGDSEKANVIGGACDDGVSDRLKNSPESGDKEAALDYVKDETRVESEIKSSTVEEGLSEYANEASEPIGDHGTETPKDLPLDYEKVEVENHGVTEDVKDETRVESETKSSAKEDISEPANEISKPQKDMPLEQIMTSESATHLKESHTVAEEDVVSGSIGMVSEAKEGALENKPVQSPTATEEKNSPARESTNVATEVGSGSLPGKSDPRQNGGSVVDISADSASPTDSLENNWGSVSALSAHSEISKKSRPAKEAPQSSSEKPEEIEAPSFMTLVESPSASEQAGWFPSKAHGPNESQGRKKNEEIIAKVTNWGDQHNQQQQRTPLKSLLGEPSQPNHQKSPPKSTTVNSILAHKETEIKREKRKSNPFMCCIRI